MKWMMEKKTTAAYVGVLLIFSLVGFVEYRSFEKLDDAAQWRRHTYEVLIHLRQLLSTLQDAETGQRGYLITGKEEYLEPYNNATRVVFDEISSLRSLTADNPSQQRHLDALLPLAKEKLDVLQEALELRRNQGFEAARTIVVTGRSKQYMDEMRGITGEMAAEEDFLLRERSARLNAEMRDTKLITGWGLFLSVLLGVFATVSANQSLYAREQAERAEKSARTYAENIFDTVREPLLVLGADLRVRTANRSFYRTFQLTPEVTLQRFVYEIGDGQWNIPSLRSLLEEILPKNSHLDDFEVIQQLPNLGQRTMLINARKVYRLGNNTDSILCAIEDIAERRRAEAERLRTQLFLDSLVENLPIMIFVKDAKELRFVRVNRACEKLLGHRREELIGKGDYDFFPKQEADFFTTLDRQVLEAGKLFDIPEETVHTKQEGIRVLHTKKIPLPDASGKPQYLLGISEDITERKQAEEALKASEQRLNLALDAAQLGIWELDLVEDKAYRNLRHDQIFGHESLQPEWGQEIFLTYVVPEDREAVKKSFEKAFATGDFGMECRIIWADKSIHWISAQGRVFRNDKGDPVRMMGTVADVTERKRAEEAIVRAKEEAERASKFKDQFLSTMSHELRTPLNAILGFSELMSDERYGALNERQHRYVGNIRTGGKHLLKLINDILDLSKIEAGHLELAREPVAVDTAVSEVLSAMQPLADSNSQHLVQDVEKGIAAWADATRFRQVLMNLLGNAIKFTPNGGRIQISARLTDERVRVEVQDSGPGIPPEEQKKIFEAFYRLRQSGQAPEGTGLGLAITQRLVELQGGVLGLESEPGKGSCFFFELPAGGRIPTALPRDESPLPATTKRQRILVIDDEPAAVQLIRSQLTASGYEVDVCDQPERATELAAQLQPDAITLDLIMKPVHGWEILLQLKSSPRTAPIPVVVVSVVDQPGVGATLGADAYLVKPVEREDLLAAVRRCLGGKGGPPLKRSVLVVEDDTATREVIGELLRGQGYAVETASDGAEARRAVEDSLPELVILDLLLPKTSGLELLAEWRAHPRTADLPVFVLSSKNLSPEEEKYLRSHAEALLRKHQPWKEDLLSQLKKALGSTQREKA